MHRYRILLYFLFRKIFSILYYHVGTVHAIVLCWFQNIPHGVIRSFGTTRIIRDRNINSTISIGNNLRLVNHIRSSHIGYSTPCVISSECGGKVLIGDNVGMSMTAICALGADITIGNNVLFGAGSKVYSSDFHSHNYLDRRYALSDEKNRKYAPVVIGDDCFIGAGALVLKGVTIGPRSIIGANAVVYKDIPADCIAIGNPCFIVKRNTNE